MRSGKAPKRITKEDPIYNSKLVTKLVNRVMYDGKKTTAEKQVYAALADIEKGGKKAIFVLETAIANISPKMEVRPRRVGGASYQVPMEVRGERRESLALRWLVTAARSKANKEFKTFGAKLAAEILEAAEQRGAAVKRREDIQKQAEANKAFSHFRW